MKKQTMCVIFGGRSSEHEVSLVSASAVMTNADPNRFNIIKLGITRSGETYVYYGSPDSVRDGSWESDRERLREATFGRKEGRGGLYIFEDGEHYFCPLDLAFPAVHGRGCEDGVLAGALDTAGIPYIGCDTESGALCMNKATTKLILARSGVPMAADYTLTDAEAASVTAADDGADGILSRIEARLGSYPLFVKPSSSGSSVGASKVRDRRQLAEAIRLAAAESGRVMVEEYIEAREVEVAVLENADGSLTVSVPGEIDPGADFYDYHTKYKADTAGYFIPARAEADKLEELRRLAGEIFRELGCSGLSRVDFFVSKSDGRIYFNEINTLPGFTPISMYPKLMAHMGIGFAELIGRLADGCLIKKS